MLGASSGKSISSTGPSRRSSRPSAAVSTRCWKAGSSGSPNGRPSGNGTQRLRGDLVISRCGRTRPITTVATPLVSIIWPSALTARVQNGQTGHSRTASTSCCFRSPTMPSAVFGHRRGIGRAHHRDVRVGDGTDRAVRRQFTQAIDRIRDVDVALKAEAVKVDRDMAHQHVRGRQRGRQLAEFGGARWKWHSRRARSARRWSRWRSGIPKAVWGRPRASPADRDTRAPGRRRASAVGYPRCAPSAALVIVRSAPWPLQSTMRHPAPLGNVGHENVITPAPLDVLTPAPTSVPDFSIRQGSASSCPCRGAVRIGR